MSGNMTPIIMVVMGMCMSSSAAAAFIFLNDDEEEKKKNNTKNPGPSPGPSPGQSPIPCVGSWSEWGACDKTCGSGTQTRTWTTTTEPKYSGTACPSPTTESQSCNTDPCPIEMDDGKAYEYLSTTTYSCKSGKDVGCAADNGNNPMYAKGVYPSCASGTTHVYCMKPKAVTDAQYLDNTPTLASHRLKAVGKRCYPGATPSYCQDDQSIAASGTGNSRKISTTSSDRQCVDNSIMYCYYPGGKEWLDDGTAYNYDSSKNYACKTGKDVGCAADNGNNPMYAKGVYPSCASGTTHVYCMKPKAVTNAQYLDNTPTLASHRLKAVGKRCYPGATPSYCQDDQSIAASGTGNSRKISTTSSDRQCVDNSIMYCYYPGGKEWLDDGTAYNYDSSKNYACKTGKDVGCVAKNGNDPMWWKGTADSNGKCPSGSDYALCLGPKQTKETRACYCQNDKSITNNKSSAGDDLSGQKRKIHTNTNNRSCVVNSGIYC